MPRREKAIDRRRKRLIMHPALWNSTLMRRFSVLDRIYTRIETAQTEFKKASADAGNPIACPERCGTCCIHFLPDVTPLEAERLALYLSVEKPELIQSFLARADATTQVKTEEKPSKACPFWNPDKPGENCMVYPARALVCRLFGYCAVTDKVGNPSFALCDMMPPLEANTTRIFTGQATLESLFGRRPPLMDEFSREILALDPSGSGQRRSIYEALPEALARVALLLRLAEESDNPLSASNPDDFPIAS